MSGIRFNLSTGLILLASVTLLALLVSLFAGRFALPWQEGLSVLWLWLSGQPITEPTQQQALTVLLDIRLPRLVAALLIGAALAVSGAAFQGLFMNPLVLPGVLGVLSGAAFGAAFGLLLGLSWITIQVASFVGAMVTSQ